MPLLAHLLIKWILGIYITGKKNKKRKEDAPVRIAEEFKILLINVWHLLTLFKGSKSHYRC
jgi:hypothetical protein